MIRIGQRLREERLQRGLSLEQVSEATKIKSSFLSAIEKGDYQKLPSSAYAQGFVQNYAQFLGLSKCETLALFRREFDQEKELQVLPEGMAGKSDFPLQRNKVHGTLLIAIGVFFFLLLYLLFQYRYFFLSPPLTVSAPKENAVISTPQVTVSGKTDPNATVTVNNEAVVVDGDGNFTKDVTVFIGKSVIMIKAKNRTNKETTVERSITVRSS